MNKRDNKAITLISLIVTIVILLILSGVTIANITGGEGAMQNASDAKNDSQKKAIQDKLQMALVTVFNEKGNIDVASVKKEILERFNGATIENNEFPLEVVIENITYLINEDTTVTQQD